MAQPRMTFESADLYPSLQEKAAALAFSLISNHPFLDGNKRVGHAAMEAFLILNGFELSATVQDSEQLVVGVASGSVSRSELELWGPKAHGRVVGLVGATQPNYPMNPAVCVGLGADFVRTLARRG